MIILAKVILSGYFGFDNIGDEAILLSMLGTFRSIRPEVDLLVLSGNPGRTRENYQIPAIKRTNIPALIRELKDCDLFVSGGRKPPAGCYWLEKHSLLSWPGITGTING